MPVLHTSAASVFSQEGVLRSESDTQLLGAMIAEIVEKGDVICLKGALGSGKTCFARAFITALCDNPGDVTSPTFALLHTYRSRKGTIWHFDLYRLNAADELLELGIEDALRDGIAIIEWPEIAEAYLSSMLRLDITFAYAGDPGTRHFLLEGYGDMIRKIQSLALSEHFQHS